MSDSFDEIEKRLFYSGSKLSDEDRMMFIKAIQDRVSGRLNDVDWSAMLRLLEEKSWK